MGLDGGGALLPCTLALSHLTGYFKQISCKILHPLHDVTVCGYDEKSFVFVRAGKCPRDGDAKELRDLLCGFSR